MAYFQFRNKRIHYRMQGEGHPLILLHGNTASSKMFDSIIDLYTDEFRVITIDFLGHGQSDRLKQFPVRLWSDEALQAIALIEHLELKKVNLLGTSGGAWVALNIALKRPGLINWVVADSFDGRTLESENNLLNGAIDQLESALLLTASHEDAMIRKDISHEYASILGLVGNGEIHLFQKGFHPAVILNASEFSKCVKGFSRKKTAH